jgi:hypothetical protein
VVQLASLAFDTSIEQMMAALACRGQRHRPNARVLARPARDHRASSIASPVDGPLLDSNIGHLIATGYRTGSLMAQAASSRTLVRSSVTAALV